ncbi:MAG: hypothetical protein ACYDBQ_10930 [Thermoplasmatota archaeon]
MVRMYTTLGACPSCGRDVARTVHTFQGVQAEVYHCPDEGRLANTIERTSLGDWAMVPTAVGIYS